LPPRPVRRLAPATSPLTLVLALAAALALGSPAPAQAPPVESAVQPPPADPATPDPDFPPEPVDPELTRPLTPLSEFDVVTDQPAPPSQSEPEPAMFRYAVTVEGLDSAGLEDRFRELSLLFQHRGDRATAGQVKAWSDEDTALLQRLMRSEGYYDGTAEITTKPTPDAPDRLAVAVTAAPGERYTLDQVVVTGPETRPPNLPLGALALSQGEPIAAPAILGAEANVKLRLPEQGYPFVTLGERDVVLDRADHTGDYSLPVDPGPRSSFGGVRLEGDRVFGPEHVAVIARFRRGELYDSRKVDDLRRALVATGLFSTVGVEPARTSAPGPDGTTAADLVVTGAAAPPRSISASAGYGTGEGARIEAQWLHRNLFPPEGSLTLRAVAGTAEQRLGATFRRSNAGRRDRTFQLLAEGSRERRSESYDATSLTLSGRLSRDSTPIWRKRWTWSAGGEFIVTSETARQDRPERVYVIAALPGQVGYDRSDDLLDPTRGYRLSARVSPEVSIRGGATPYVRTLFDGSAYLPLSRAAVLAGRVRLGMIGGAKRADLAPSRRLYGGGGGSVRGFGYRELGPIAANGERVGGRSLIEAAVEARYRFGNFGVVPFIDAGQAYTSVTPRFSDIRFGVGIGARYYTNFGPVRIDVATPVDRRPGEPRVAVYISIGQAF
jgi:translocation and assembly module TamA